MRTQTSNKLLLYIPTVYYFILYILLKAFPLISSSLSSRCHLVSASLLFVPQFHCSVLQFQHFNISSNISRAESSVAELFSTTGNLGEKKVWHTCTHAHTNTGKHLDLWFSVWIFAGEKCEMVILELWPGKEIGRSIRRTDPPSCYNHHPQPCPGADGWQLSNPPSLFHPQTLTRIHTVPTHTPTHAQLPINQDDADGVLGHSLRRALSWICDIFNG